MKYNLTVGAFSILLYSFIILADTTVSECQVVKKHSVKPKTKHTGLKFPG